MSRFLQNTRALFQRERRGFAQTFEKSKLKIKGFGVYPNSYEAIIVVVSSFAEQLGNYADEILKLDNIDASNACVRVNFPNENMEGKN